MNQTKEGKSPEEIKKATEIVDNFLAILQEWFHPNTDWERIENTANEFLFEDILATLVNLNTKHELALHQAEQRVAREIRDMCENQMEITKKLIATDPNDNYYHGFQSGFRFVKEEIDHKYPLA